MALPLRVTMKIVDRMLELADHVATWSSCPKGRQHGCVLAFKGKYVIATGFNGPSAIETQCTICQWPVNRELCPAIHAEQNAVINAIYTKADLTECVAFMTKEPCDRCKRFMVNAKIPLAIYVNKANQEKIDVLMIQAYPWKVESFMKADLDILWLLEHNTLAYNLEVIL